VIPPIRWRDQSTSPLTIQVTDTPATPTGTPPVFIEAEWDAPTALPGEQRLLQVRLLFREDLTQGELSHPDHPDAQVIQLGNQTDFTRLINGQRYHGRLRRYAVFASKPGTLEWAPITFRGLLLGGPARTLRKRSVTGTIAPLTILPLPDNAPVPWLPARALSLSERWSPEVTTLKVGDSLTRDIRLEARGLDASALNEVTWQVDEGLRLYSTPVQRHTRHTSDGLVGTLTQSWTLVATRPGRYRIPPLEIQWWDARKHAPASVQLSARTIVVEGAPTTPLEVNSGAGSGTPSRSPETSVWIWQAATGMLAILTLGLLYRLRQTPQTSSTTGGRPALRLGPKSDLPPAPPAYQGDPAAFLSAARHWLDLLADLALPDSVCGQLEEADRLQRALDAAAYGPDCPGARPDASQLSALASKLKALHRNLKRTKKNEESPELQE
ncbi:MAG: hypothetical protein D6758_07115, partial [Gammaproteobacteria bacterium]